MSKPLCLLSLQRIARRAALVVSATLLLPACALFGPLDAGEPGAESELPYLQALSRGYDALAGAEEAEHDWRDGARFRDRALRARSGVFVEPEAIDHRDLPGAAIADLAAARARLVALLDAGAPLLAGPAAARAQVAFDCWMQEQEEGHQPADIADCRAAFDTAMTELDDLATRLIVVLLPDPSGAVGAVELSNAGGSERLSVAGEAGILARGETPAAAGRLDESAVQRFFGGVLAAQPESPVSFTLYFIAGTDRPTTESQALLPSVLAEIRRRQAPDVTVIGHTDRQGGAGANFQLALRRATAIAAMVEALGVQRDVIDVRSFGETDTLVPTADGVAEAQDRRVEITVR